MTGFCKSVLYDAIFPKQLPGSLENEKSDELPGGMEIDLHAGAMGLIPFPRGLG